MKTLLTVSCLFLCINAMGEEPAREPRSKVASQTTGLVNATDKTADEPGQAPKDVTPAKAVTWVNETFNHVNGGKTFVLKNPGTNWLRFVPPGLDSKSITCIKLSPGYQDSEISDQRSLGSNGMALVKRSTACYGKIAIKLDPPLTVATGKGWVTYTCDSATQVCDTGKGGWFGIELNDGPATPFTFRQSSKTAEPVLSFWMNDKILFGNEEKVSSLGPAGKFSPPVKIRCVMAYNQTTPGMWDVELGYRVANGPWKIASKKGIPGSDRKTMDAGEFEYWKGSVFWLNNLKLEWEVGSYEVKPTGTYPVAEPRKGS